MRAIFLTLSCCLAAFGLSAQTVTPPHLIPPSPTAYAFAKYGDVPVSLATGIPNIGVPIFKLSEHDVSLDVSLSYYAGGVKVDEEATNVGLGWSLNAGGSITRVVRGKPDELYNGAFQPRTDIPMTTPAADSTLPLFISQYGLDAAAHGGTDNEPDLFIFNFGGRTGKFCFDKNGHVVMLKKEDLEIAWQAIPGGSGVEFIVRDERGFTYTFAQPESTYIPSVTADAVTSWFLTQIKSPTGNEIDITYHTWQCGHYSNNSLPEFVLLSNTYTGTIFPTGTPSSPPYNLSNRAEVHIDKVSCSSGNIQFTYDTQPRQDNYANEDFALKDIAVYNADQVLLKKFTLNTSYFEANDAHKYPSTTAVYQHLNKRLRLDGVQEYGMDGLTPAAPPYQFAYLGDNDPTTDDKYTLPARLSPEQDHWGYYNYSGNALLYPGGSNITVSSAAFGGNAGSAVVSLSSGANREPDTAAMKAGMLQRIVYPTGGHTDFLFEANYSSTYKEGGVRLKAMKDYPLAGTPKEKDYAYTGSSYSDPSKYYYELYHVLYSSYTVSNPPPYYQTLPDINILAILGVPYQINQPSHAQWEDYVKVTAQSQQVLAQGRDPGYDEVRVTEPGNGYMVSDYDNYLYPDYNGDDPYNEGTAGELALLTGIFQGTLVDHYLDQFGNYNNLVQGISLTWRDWPYVPIFDNSWKRGVESSRGYYRENGTLIRAENYTYDRKLLSMVPGYMVFDLDPAAQANYFWATYGIPSGQTRLKSKNEIIYDAAGQHPVTTTTNYYYDNTAHQQATRAETSRSDGKTAVSLTSYPLDQLAGTTFIDNMVAGHLIAYPIEQVSYVDDGTNKKIVSGSVTYYQGANGLPDQVKTLQKASGADMSSFKFANRATAGIIPPSGANASFSPDSQYETRLQFGGYDDQANVKSVSKTGAPKICYVWGYGGSYPVAQVTNADYSAVETALGGSAAVQTFRNTAFPTDAAVNAFLAPLRSLTNLPNAQVTSYTYMPLIGMTSATDARGNKTTYEYDQFSRLINVRDQFGSIKTHYCYNYAGQSVDCSVPVVPVGQTVYARLVQTGSTVTVINGSSHTLSTFAVNLYSNQACTDVYTTPTDLAVNYTQAVTTTDASNNSSTFTYLQSVTVFAGRSTGSTGSIDMSGCSDGGGGIILQRAQLISKTSSTAKAGSKTSSAKAGGGTTNGVPGGGDGGSPCFDTVVAITTGTGYVPVY